MTITVDLATEDVRTGTTSPQTFSHAGAASGVNGVLLSIVHGVSSTDHVSAASYGGVAMSRVQRNTDTATEPGAAEWWFLGSGVPQGTQTVSYTPGSTTDDIHAVAITLLAAADLQVVDSDGVSENVANPSVTLQYGNASCMAFGALYGGGADGGAFAPNANCTTVHDHDLGAFYSEIIRQTTAGTANFAIGGTSTSDDVAFAAVAVSEIPPPAQAPADDFGRFADDDAAFHATLFSGGFQQTEGAPNPDQVQWHWEDDLGPDEQFLIEASFRSQPVDFVPTQQPQDPEFDQGELYDDPVIELAEAMQPVQAQAPPDAPTDDAWPWPAEDATDTTPVPSGYQQAEGAPNPAIDAWDWSETLVDEWESDQVLGADGSAPAPAAPEDAWPWDDAALEHDTPHESGPIVADAPDTSAIADAWSAFEDELLDPFLVEDTGPVSEQPAQQGALPDGWEWRDEDSGDTTPVPSGYQQADASPDVSADSWPFDDAADEAWLDESRPVVADGAAAPAMQPANDDFGQFEVDLPLVPVFETYQQFDGEDQPTSDAWDWDVLAFDEWPDHQTIAPVPPSVDLNTEDAWLRVEEFADDHWQEESAAVVADGEQVRVEDAWDWAEPVDERETRDIIDSSDRPVAPDASVFLNVEDAWPHVDEFADDHYQEESAPVVADGQILTNVVEDGYRYFDDYAEDPWQEESAPVGANGPPADPPHGESWNFDAADQVDQVGVFESYQQSDGEPNAADDAWPWFDDGLEQDPLVESAPVVANGEQVRVDDDWQWDERPFDDWSGDSEPVVADGAAPVSQPLEPEFIEDYLDDELAVTHQADSAPVAEDQPVPADAWPAFEQDAADDWHEEQQPVVPDAGPVLPEDAWQWFEEFVPNEWQEESAVVGPDVPPNPLLNIEDPWDWFDEVGLDEYEHLHRMPEFEIRDVGDERRFIVRGADRRFVVEGEDRRFIVRGERRRFR